MNTNDNFNSKKIMDDIDSLENDPQGKKRGIKNKVINVFETIILVVLIGIVIITVIYSCFESLMEDISYDYSYDNDYYFAVDNNLESEDKLVTDITLEEFLNSDLGNKIITESNTNALENTLIEDILNSNLNEENLNTNETVIEETVDTRYDSDAILRQEIEEQRKNLIIKEEGKSVNNELILSIENKNVDMVHDLYIYTIFYKENQIVGINQEEIDLIIKDNKKYLKIEEMPPDYDKYEIFITKYGNMLYNNTVLNDDVICDSYIENELIEINIKNNSTKKINRVDITILYYDSNKNILDIDDVADFNIRKYGTGNATGYGVWSEEEQRYIEFDSYELILDSALYYEY